MAIDLDYIVNLGDEDLMKLNRKQIIYRLKKANAIAVDRRNEALEYLRENPQIPTPLIYKKYGKTVKPKAGVTDWRNYDFDFENGESLNELRSKLRKTRGFLQAKTSSIDDWLNSLNKLTGELAESLGMEVEFGDIRSFKYKRLWRAYEILAEKYPDLARKKDSGAAFDSENLRNTVFETMVQAEYRGYGVSRLATAVEEALKRKGLIGGERGILSEEELQYLQEYEQEYETAGMGRQGR